MLTLQHLCWHENHTSWCDFCNGAKLRRADLESETSHTGWLTATLRWSVYKYSDRSGSKWVGVSTGTHWDGRKYSDMWELGFSLPERLGQSFRRHDVRGVYTTCSSWGLLPFILYRTAFHVGKKCFPVWCKHSLIHANFLKFDPRINFSQKTTLIMASIYFLSFSGTFSLVKSTMVDLEPWEFTGYLRGSCRNLAIMLTTWHV